jgi:hypothetical protein
MQEFFSNNVQLIDLIDPLCFICSNRSQYFKLQYTSVADPDPRSGIRCFFGLDLYPFLREFIYKIHKKKFTMCDEWFLARNEQSDHIEDDT